MLEISKAEITDAESIIMLQRLSYQSEAKIYNDWSLPALTQTVESLCAEFEKSVILKATKNGDIIGSVRATISDNICKIGRLIVHPESQRQGIGSNLLNKIETLYAHAEKFELFTGSKSLSNIRLYEKNGYSISHTQTLSENVSIIFLIKKNTHFQHSE